MFEDPIVLDTNVLLSGLKSRNGLSFKLLERILASDLRLAISTPLILEYESTLKKVLVPKILSMSDVDTLLDSICSMGVQARIFYLWRPYLKDPYDDHILELAVAAGSKYIVTYNRKDFQDVDRFGIQVLEPREVLRFFGGTV